MSRFSLSVIATLFVYFRFVAHVPCIGAVNLHQCGVGLQEDQEWNPTLNTTDPIFPPSPSNLSYEDCVAWCGSGVGDPNVQDLSQNFGAWFLPWIPLMFQIPSGADDILSFLFTIGSPALAAYSLQITYLNTRWIAAAFSDVKYPNSKHMPAVLSAFHHIPIEISHHPPSLHSLIVLPQNDDFWRHLFAAANKTRRWPISLFMGLLLAIVALILTIMDSFNSPNPSGDIGYAIAAIWIFLFPLVTGWLHVGCEPEPNHLKDSLEAANLKAWVATDQRDQPAKNPSAIYFMGAEDVDLARRDELFTAPLFNYARAFVSPLVVEQVLGLVKNAAANAEQNIPVGNDGGVLVWVENEGDTIADANRIGTSAEVAEYCTRIFPKVDSNSGSTTPPDIQSPRVTGTTQSPLPVHDPHLVTQYPSLWATKIQKRVAIATASALWLQWGTVGAAVYIHYKSPPVGLGCRAASFLLYAAAGTVSFFLLLTSSILAHMSRPYQGQIHARPWLRACQNAGAIICQWLGKCVAILSAMGILVVCAFQVAGTFDNCFCASTTFDKGRGSVLILTINYWVGHSTRVVWVCGLAMAFTITFFFYCSIAWRYIKKSFIRFLFVICGPRGI
jgi:hypothetical protein